MGLMHGFLERVAAARQAEQLERAFEPAARFKCTCDKFGRCFVHSAEEKRTARAKRRRQDRGPYRRTA